MSFRMRKQSKGKVLSNKITVKEEKIFGPTPTEEKTIIIFPEQTVIKPENIVMNNPKKVEKIVYDEVSQKWILLKDNK